MHIKNIIRNWKTSSLGIAAIATGITLIVNDKTKITEGVTAILTGIGFLFAADSNTPIDDTKA